MTPDGDTVFCTSLCGAVSIQGQIREFLGNNRRRIPASEEREITLLKKTEYGSIQDLRLETVSVLSIGFIENLPVRDQL